VRRATERFHADGLRRSSEGGSGETTACSIARNLSLKLDPQATDREGHEREGTMKTDRSESLVDLSRIEEVAGGNHDFVLELIEMFLADAEQLLAAMKRAIEARDAESLRVQAHSLKGSSANFDAHALREAAQRLEESSRDSRLEEAPALLESIRFEFERVREALNAAAG